MSITQKPYGVTKGGIHATEYTLTNAGGACVSILDFGGVVTRILVPDREGKLGDVNLGFDDVNAYAGDCGSMGGLIGRFGNRIGGAAFSLEGKDYILGKNNGGNNLHGGPEGFNVKQWKAEPSEKEGVCSLRLTLTSPDGDQGFPGTLRTEVVYTFDSENALSIHYHATTDKPTLCNLTNHCYFNLDGHDAGSIGEQELVVHADYVTEVDAGLIPTGELIPTKELCYGFARPTRLGEVLDLTESNPDLKAAGGVDFNYCAGRNRETKLCAALYSPKTGRELSVVTDQPGVQVYTGQFLCHTGKDGARYERFGGICLETQHYPDGIHHPHFPSVVLRPQDVYDTFTQYRFSVRK